MDSSSMKESHRDNDLQVRLQSKATMWKYIAWLQCIFYYIMRASYVILQTNCYYRNFDRAHYESCIKTSSNMNTVSTVMVCISIATFLIVDLCKIRKSIKDQQIDDDNAVRETFKLNEVTVSIVIGLIVLQIVAVWMTMPAIGFHTQMAYNILDCVICLEYLGLTYFMWDMSRSTKQRECSIIVDQLGNVIVIKVDQDTDDIMSEETDDVSRNSGNLYKKLRISNVSEEMSIDG